MGNAVFKDCRFRRDKANLLTESLIVAKDINFRDEYDVMKEIGKGSMSTIYMIRKKKGQSYQKMHENNQEAGRADQVSDQDVVYYALKETDLAKIDARDLFDVFQNEVEILRRLDHPNIVRAHETYSYRTKDGINMTGIVQELCQGGDLNSRTPYTEKQAGVLLFKLVKAVYYMHKQNVMHLDIKMENIMYETNEPDSDIKLIDFGCSTMYSKNQNFDVPVGTAYYMAPQVIMGQYNFQADMWSAGVVAFILLSGEKPFCAETLPTLRQKIFQGKYSFDSPAWNSVSEEAKQFVAKLLEYDPSLRYTAGEALKSKWLTQFKPSADEATVKSMLSKLQQRPSMTSDLEKLVWTNIARNANVKAIAHIRQLFEVLDQDHDGKIEYAEFKRFAHKITGTSKEIDQIFRKIDVSKAGAVDYTSFVAALMAVQEQLQDHHLAEVFDRFDLDHRGYISMEHLRQKILGTKISKAYIDKLVDEIDTQKSGKIDFQSFKNAFSKR